MPVYGPQRKPFLSYYCKCLTPSFLCPCHGSFPLPLLPSISSHLLIRTHKVKHLGPIQVCLSVKTTTLSYISIAQLYYSTVENQVFTRDAYPLHSGPSGWKCLHCLARKAFFLPNAYLAKGFRSLHMPPRKQWH